MGLAGNPPLSRQRRGHRQNQTAIDLESLGDVAQPDRAPHMDTLHTALSGTSAQPVSPVTANDGVHHLLDIDVNTLAVPVVGRTTVPDVATDLPLVVLDPKGTEVVWVTRTLRSLRANGLSDSTVKAYAKSFLRAARPMWAIGADPATLTITEYAVTRAWLRMCLRLSAPRKDDAARHLSPATLQQTEAALLTVYEEAKRHGLVADNPIALFRGTEELHTVGKVLFDTDQRRGRNPRSIARVVEKNIVTLGPADRHRLRTAKRLRDRALWTLCLDSGPRISEALSITPATYFPKQNYADVIGKGLDGATRLIPLADETTEAIDAYVALLRAQGLRLAAEDPIFRSIKAPFEPLTYNGAHKALRRALGRKDIHPHVLRHTAATELLDLLEGSSGRRLITVQITLGHKQLSTTRRYLHVDTSEVIAAVVKARQSPLRAADPILRDTYGADEMELLKSIRMETP